jgi:hypothetical protein
MEISDTENEMDIDTCNKGPYKEYRKQFKPEEIG